MFNGSIYVRSKSTKGDAIRLGKRKKAEVRRPRRLPPEVLTDDEVTKLLRACSHRAPTGIRNRALIALLYRSGLRINEALSLYPKDLELDKGIVRVLNGKGGRSRTIGIDPGAAGIVQRWLDKRQSLGANGRQPLFCTLDGEPMSASYVRVMLKRLAFKSASASTPTDSVTRTPPNSARKASTSRSSHANLVIRTLPLRRDIWIISHQRRSSRPSPGGRGLPPDPHLLTRCLPATMTKDYRPYRPFVGES